MLPFGSIGRKRAEQIRIISAKSSSISQFFTQNIQQSKAVAPLQNRELTNDTVKSISKLNESELAFQKSELGNIWETFARLSKMNPPPYWNFPNKWKVYKAAISRYEQLILIGESSEANRILPLIQRLSAELEQQIILPRHLINGTMSLLEKYYNYTNQYQPQWLASEFEKHGPNLIMTRKR